MSSYPIDVRVDPTQAVAGSRRIKGALRETRKEASALQSTAKGLFAGAAVSAAISRSIGLLADFSQEMSTVKAVTQATDDQFRALKSTAEALGRTTRFSASQAAEGMTFLARAGFDADEVLGSIEGTLNLAQAGGLGLASAADIASNSLQGMRLEVDQTGRVVDVFALAANSSNTNVQQLGHAMSFVAPIASGLGVSLEGTTAAIGALSDAGIQGSSAGTGLRRVLIGLENPSKEAEKILKSLGITADDVRVSQVGLTAALETLSKSGLTTAQALEIFGDRGGPAAEVLLQVAQSAEGTESALVQMTKNLENADGTAKRIADTMDDNLNGALLAAKSSIEGFVISMGNAGSEDALVILVQGLTTGFRFAAENADILTFAIVAYAVQALIGAGAGSTLLTTTIASTKAFFAQTASLRLSTVAMIGASAAARTLGASMLAFAVANPVLLGLAALAAAFYFLRDSAKDTGDEIRKAEGTLAKFRSASSSIQRDTELLADRNDDLAEAIKKTGDAAQTAARLEIDAIRGRIERNTDLKNSYLDVLKSQLATAKATKTSNDDKTLSKLTGVSRTETTVNTLSRSGFNVSLKSSAKFQAEANAELLKQIEIIGKLQDEDKKLNDIQVKTLEFYAKTKEELNEILNLEQTIADLESGKPKAKTDDGGGGFGTENVIKVDFETQLSELQKETEALGLNARARENRNKVLQFEKDLERDFADGEQAKVEREIQKQQALLDNTAIRQRIRDIEDENSILGINVREAEARGAVLALERDILRELTPEEEARLRAVIEQNQALRDSDAIDKRLDALANQADLLKKVGIEADVTSEILRLQDQLQRDLTDTEKSWIENAVRLNDELARRNQILTDARQPQEDMKSDMAALNDLYSQGAISVREYARALSEVSLANEARDLDRELNAGGANIGPSQFEQERIRAEEKARMEEGGGVGVNPDEAYGFSGRELGVEDELEQEREKAQARLDLLRQMQDAELLQESEFRARKEEVLKQSEKRQEEILRKGAQLQLSNAENLFGSITDILGKTLGEQNGLYKAAFVAQKAAAIGQSIIAIQTGIAQAAALPFPANLGAMASVAAATASIVSNIQAVRLKLATGGDVGERYDGVVRGKGSRKSDSIPAMLSRDEFVVQADNAQKSLGILHAVNEGKLNDANMARAGFAMGGQAGSPPANAFGSTKIPANDRRGSTMIHVGGITVQVSGGEGDAQKMGEEVGEAAARTLIEMVLSEHIEQPGGIIYERLANG